MKKNDEKNKFEKKSVRRMEEEKGFQLKMSNFPIAKVVYLY